LRPAGGLRSNLAGKIGQRQGLWPPVGGRVFLVYLIIAAAYAPRVRFSPRSRVRRRPTGTRTADPCRQRRRHAGRPMRHLPERPLLYAFTLCFLRPAFEFLNFPLAVPKSFSRCILPFQFCPWRKQGPQPRKLRCYTAGYSLQSALFDFPPQSTALPPLPSACMPCRFSFNNSNLNAGQVCVLYAFGVFPASSAEALEGNLNPQRQCLQ
jgi:hypothetical protein